MENNIYDKYNELSHNQIKIFNEELRGILEWRDNCRTYGAKDPVNLPKEDYNIIKQNLYREMFESKNIKPF